MTIQEWAVKHCTDNGMWPDQAQQVVKAFMDDPTYESMSGRWSDDVAGYPCQLLAVISIGVDRQALAWIDKNLPNAWFRPVFDPFQSI